MRYRVEREEFALALRQESVTQSREQLRRAEAGFKEEVERVRRTLYEQVAKEYERTAVPVNGGQFKTQLQ